MIAGIVTTQRKSSSRAPSPASAIPYSGLDVGVALDVCNHEVICARVENKLRCLECALHDNHLKIVQYSFVHGKNGHEGESKPRAFVTTRWSLILSAVNGSEEQKARDALAELCRTYWRPIFSFVQARGYSIEDAQDLTQDFFLTRLEHNWLQHADRNRGRFRSLLLRSLQNFLINTAEKTHARKRGGGAEFISWDEWMAEVPSQLSLPAQALKSLPPERLFDLAWATTVVEHALQRLREECESKGKLWLFQALSSRLTDERDEVSYANLSVELGMAETAVKKQLHNMRQRYRSLLRDEVSQTVDDPADVDDEIRYLCASLATATE
jgi:DNA-directed RNA polymerase specialized sigma24 family protein